MKHSPTHLFVAALFGSAALAPIGPASAQSASGDQATMGAAAGTQQRSALTAAKLRGQALYTEDHIEVGQIRSLVRGPDRNEYAVVQRGERQFLAPLNMFGFENDRFVLRNITRENPASLPGYNRTVGGYETLPRDHELQIAGYSVRPVRAATPEQKQMQRAQAEGAQKEQMQRARAEGAEITVRDTQPRISVEQAQPRVIVRQPQPDVTVRQPNPQIVVRQAPPTITVQQPQPEIIVRMPEPDVNVAMAQPDVRVIVPQPEVNVVQPEREQAAVAVQRSQAQVQIVEAEGDPNVAIARSQPQVRFERTGEPQVRYQQAEGQPTIRYERMERTDANTAARAGTNAVREGWSDMRAALGVGIDRAPTTGNMTAVGIPDLEGTEVYNFRGELIGDVSSVRVGPGGQVMIAIEHGGFLGIGEEQFALPVERFYKRGNELFVRGITERDLEMMEEYQGNIAGWREAAPERRLSLAQY